MVVTRFSIKDSVIEEMETIDKLLDAIPKMVANELNVKNLPPFMTFKGVFIEKSRGKFEVCVAVSLDQSIDLTDQVSDLFRKVACDFGYDVEEIKQESLMALLVEEALVPFGMCSLKNFEYLDTTIYN